MFASSRHAAKLERVRRPPVPAVLPRRGFLAGLGAAALAAPAAEARPLKFLVASDIHYRPGVFPHDDAAWLDRIVARAEAERVAFALQLGDFVHAARASSAYLAHWHGASVPTYNVLGNHDDDGGPHAETLEAFRLARAWYHFDVGGFRFVVLDTNWACLDGRFVHYARGAGFTPWKLPRGAAMRLHPDELDWLAPTLLESPFPCVLCAHRRLDGADADSRAVCALIRRANAAHPGRVRLVLNGHNHNDAWKVREGVAWYLVNSANHCWIPKRHAAYPAEDVARWKEIDHVVAYDTPLSAVITLTPAGGIAVSGMKGRFWRDIPPARCAAPYRISPDILDRTLENPHV